MQFCSFVFPHNTTNITILSYSEEEPPFVIGLASTNSGQSILIVIIAIIVIIAAFLISLALMFILRIAYSISKEKRGRKIDQSELRKLERKIERIKRKPKRKLSVSSDGSNFREMEELEGLDFSSEDSEEGFPEQSTQVRFDLPSLNEKQKMLKERTILDVDDISTITWAHVGKVFHEIFGDPGEALRNELYLDSIKLPIPKNTDPYNQELHKRRAETCNRLKSLKPPPEYSIDQVRESPKNYRRNGLLKYS